MPGDLSWCFCTLCLHAEDEHQPCQTFQESNPENRVSAFQKDQRKLREAENVQPKPV